MTFVNVEEVYFASYGEFSQACQLGPAKWPYYDLLAVHRGQLHLECAEDSIELYCFDAILIPPETLFSGTVKSKDLLASVHHFDLQETNCSKEYRVYRSDVRV